MAAATERLSKEPAGSGAERLTRPALSLSRVHPTRPTMRLRLLPHNLCEAQPLRQGGRVRAAGARTAAGSAGLVGPGHAGAGQHNRRVPRAWDGHTEQKGHQAIDRSSGGLTCKMHVVAAGERSPLAFSPSSGQATHGPVGRVSLRAPLQLFGLSNESEFGGPARESSPTITGPTACRTPVEPGNLRCPGTRNKQGRLRRQRRGNLAQSVGFWCLLRCFLLFFSGGAAAGTSACSSASSASAAC